MSQPPCCHRCGKGSAVYRPHSALRNLRCPQRGSRFATPPLPWDGVALSYPTDATICHTGTAVAPCDNGAAADRLAGVRISDAGGAASSCPKLGRLPAGVIVLPNAAPPAPEMLTFTNISVLDLRFFKVFAPVQQAPYIAEIIGNMASCPDGGQLPALSAAPGWACGGVLLFGGIISLWGGVCGFCGWLGLVAGDLC